MSEHLDYWKSFYESAQAPAFPSQFAVFLQSWFVRQPAHIFEFGSGNGRDARFLHAQGHRVTATDQVINPVLVELAETSDRFDYLEGDVQETSSEIFQRYDPTTEAQPVVFSRFFQHSIPDAVEKVMANNLADNIPAGTMLFFEFRLDQDRELTKEFGSGHFRRYQTANQFTDLMTGLGFTSVFQTEGTGYANYAAEDPYIGRFVFAAPGAPGAEPGTAGR